MRRVDELSNEEYMDVVIAFFEEENPELWCQQHNIDYEDALEYEWD